MNDSEIINLYIKRDENAITETKFRYGSKLCGLSFKVLKNSEDTEECVNDTYLKAWNTIPPQIPTYFFAYLAKICRFICFGKLDYSKAQKRNAEIVTLSDELANSIPYTLSELEVEENYLGEVLTNFLNSLSFDDRFIFMRRYWFFDSIKEICNDFNYKESRVKTSLFRTREKLKKHLESEGFNYEK